MIVKRLLLLYLCTGRCLIEVGELRICCRNRKSRFKLFWIIIVLEFHQNEFSNIFWFEKSYRNPLSNLNILLKWLTKVTGIFYNRLRTPVYFTKSVYNIHYRDRSALIKIVTYSYSIRIRRDYSAAVFLSILKSRRSQAHTETVISGED